MSIDTFSSNPKVSIIITTYNSSLTLDKCLLSIKNQSYKNIELLVVDNKSKDETVKIAKKYTELVFCAGPERSAQRNYGIEKSSGEFIIVIDSDMILSEQVTEDVVLTFIEKNEKIALVIPEQSFGEGFWANCKKLERTFYVGVNWMEAARAFRKNIIVEVGGYDEENTGTEDYDLPHRVEQIYGKNTIGRINKYIYHNEGNLQLLRSCYKKFYYSKKLATYINKKENYNYFIKQSNPFHRYILFFKSPKILFKNPLIGFGMLYMKFCELFFGYLGYLFRRRNSNIKNSIYR